MKKILLIVFLSSYTLLAQWADVQPLPDNFRTDHSFGFALNDKGYVVTGSFQDNTGQIYTSSNFYSYSSTDDSWTKLSDFPGKSRGFSIGDTWNGKAYLGFGIHVDSLTFSEEYLKDLWVFDPNLNTWTQLAPCPCEPRIHPAMIAQNGKIYIGLGGSEFGNLKDWWEYDIATNSWSQKIDFPSHHRHHPYQFGIGDYVYTGLGHGTEYPVIYSSWYRYNPITNSWSEMSALPAEGRVAGTQFSHNNYGYVLSGDGSDHNSMAEGEFWQYDPADDSWFQMPSHPGSSRWAPASFILDDHVYLINGSSYGIYESQNYKYDLNQPVNTKDIVIEDFFRISPNPFLSNVNFHTMAEGHYTISVLDIQGKVLHQLQNDKDITVDLSFLSKGVYLLKIEYEKHVFIQKVMKR
jgi:N-acetylneuraminic acid mutarotase